MKVQALLQSREKEIFKTFLELIYKDKPGSEGALKPYYEVLKTIFQREMKSNEKLTEWIDGGLVPFMKSPSSGWPDFPKEAFDYYLSISPSAKKKFNNAVIFQNYLPEGTEIRARFERTLCINKAVGYLIYAKDKAEAKPKKYDHINFKPSAGAAKEAQEGLNQRKEYGRGGTEVGIARARDLKNRKELSPSTVKRMYSFFKRHEPNKKSKTWKEGHSDGGPSNSRIAWNLWGGDSGYAWCRKVVKQMEAADKKAKS